MTVIAGKMESMEAPNCPCPSLTKSPECVGPPEGRQGCCVWSLLLTSLACTAYTTDTCPAPCLLFSSTWHGPTLSVFQAHTSHAALGLSVHLRGTAWHQSVPIRACTTIFPKTAPRSDPRLSAHKQPAPGDILFGECERAA